MNRKKSHYKNKNKTNNLNKNGSCIFTNIKIIKLNDIFHFINIKNIVYNL